MARSVLDIIFRTKKEGDAARGLQREVKDLSGALGSLGIGAQLTAAGGVAALAAGLKFSIDQAAESQRVNAQTAAVLRSTGSAAGLTAVEIQRLSTALSAQSTYSDESVQSMQNVLLTFTAIKDDVMPGAAQAVIDMSVALGQDLQGSAIQVGKALQDPILGVTALRRVGVNFSKDQQEFIKSLVDTGHAAEAQALILKELNTEFGGSAQAQVETYSGRIAQLKNAVGELGEAAAESEIGGRSLIDWLTDAAAAGTLLITASGRITDALQEHEEQMVQSAPSYELYIQEMVRAGLASGRLSQTEADIILGLREQTRVLPNAAAAMERLGIKTEFAYNTAQIYDDRLESVRERLREVADASGEAEEATEDVKDAFQEQIETLAEAYLKNLEYKASTDDVARAIAALRSKHIEITVTTITEEITRQTWEWRGALATPNIGSGGGAGGVQQAAGGLLAPLAKIGEAGYEYVVETPNGFVVIPHEASVLLERIGALGAASGMKLGGEVESGGLNMQYTPDSYLRALSYAAGAGYYTGTGGAIVTGGGSGGGFGTSGGGGGGTAAAAAVQASAELVAETAGQAAGAAAAFVGGQIPMAVALESRESNLILAEGMKDVVMAIKNLEEVIPRAVRDAVAQL